jgi:SNF2 family DNA or RNA helicase
VSARSIGSTEFDLELEDLLANLQALASWPSDDTDVRWQPELAALVESNLRDARALKSRLAGSQAPDFAVVRLSGQWVADLTDFQKRDIAKLLQLENGANFSVPGAGKTRVAWAVFDALREAGKVDRILVACPKSAFESWQLEAEVCYGERAPVVGILDGSALPECDALLVNYERLPDAQVRLTAWMRQAKTLLVLDEAHRTKLGPAGAWGSACLAMGAYAVSRLILTGTPAPNGPKDLENLFGFVWPGQGRAAVTRALVGNELPAASRLLQPLFTRTTKAELALPPVDRAIRRVPLPPLHRELYDALVGQSSERLRGHEQDAEALGRILMYLIMAATSPALLSTGATKYEPLPYRVPPLSVPANSSLGDLLKNLPHYELSPKYVEAASIARGNAELGRKTLIWSTFVRNLTSLGQLSQQLNPAVIHGGTVDREAELRRFRQDPDCWVLLSNPATLGEGVSLHHDCHDAVYVDRDFSAGRYLQSLDRIHRLGLSPDARTQVTVLIGERTIDEVIEQRLAKKLEFMGGILDDAAVQQLADLEEEPTVTMGMDSNDLRALIVHVSGSATS